MASSKTGVELRPTTAEDLPLLLAWRHNPLVMEYFIDSGETWEEHIRWWDSKPNSFVILYYGRPVGEAHYTITKAHPEVGLYIGETTLWGKRVGRRAMEELLKRIVDEGYGRAFASVHPQNRRSQRMFKSLGFTFIQVKADGYLLYRRELEGPPA